MTGIAVVALHARGLTLAGKLARSLPNAAIHVPRKLMRGSESPFDSVAVRLRELFAAGTPIVGIMASGILVRLLAPLLDDKTREPAVLAVSDDGRFVVPLLGGHHGANKLAEGIAKALGGKAAVTTASESAFGIALDDPPPGWAVANPKAAKTIIADLLAGHRVALTVESGKAGWLAPLRKRTKANAKRRVLVTDRAVGGSADTLVLHPPTLVLGIGCERGAAVRDLIACVRATLKQAELAQASIACVASLDLKADEEAVTALATTLKVPARFFAAKRLERERPRLANPSKTVFEAVGCHGVAEGAALAAAGRGATLVVPKIKGRRVTVAIARAAREIDPDRVGRARGKLSVVGLGPGTPELLTPRAAAALREAADIVGYGLYLDFLDTDLTARRHDFPLGAETERVDYALKRAAEGRTVALVASGDPGIYALATLVFERMAAKRANGVQRIAVEVIPGVSSFLAGAALAGAPLGHDFAAISLSDLLTPWETIEKRLTAAADGDFAVALFNPASKRRSWQLARARDILLTARDEHTPVAVVRNVGRPDERLLVKPLGKLECQDADMTTLVIVGARATQILKAGGRRWIYTPRGYDAKRRKRTGTEADR
jgi:cobalt-precorrin 5A hydrolase/precorrin-3B C17-methyltransferase